MIYFLPHTGILAGGTDRGRVAMWKYAPAPGLLARKQDSETKWKLQPPSDLEGSILQIKWGSSKNLLAVNTIAVSTVLSEHIMSAHLRDQVNIARP